MKHVAFDGRLVMLGFGSIGQGVLPLILRHIDMPKDRITIVTAETRGATIAAEYGVAHHGAAADARQLRAELRARLSQGRLPAATCRSTSPRSR